MNYIKIMITVCILFHQKNLFSSHDDIDQKLSIEYTRAEKIVRHLTAEIQNLEKELKSKQTDYQPTLDEIKHEISLLETIIHNSPGFHDDVAKNIQGGQAYLKWFSLEYVRKKIKEETDKHNKDILKKAAKKICLQKQKNKGKKVPKKSTSNKQNNIEKICADTTLQDNIIVPEISKTHTHKVEQETLVSQTTLPTHNEQDHVKIPVQTPWYYPSQWYQNLQNFASSMYQNIVDVIKFVGNIN